MAGYQYDSMQTKGQTRYTMPAKKAAKPSGAMKKGSAANTYGDCCGDNSVNCDRNC